MKPELISRRYAITAIAAALAPLGLPLHAQDRYPSRPIRVLLGVPAGGSFDLVMRPLAAQLSQRLSQPVLLDHRPGANQQISVTGVTKATPDGYTLLMASDAALSVAPAMQTSLPYDPKKELIPLGVINHISLMLVTQPANPISTLADLVARAKAMPGQISYASLGVGSIAHIAMEAFAEQNGIELLHVPYQGTAPAVTATAGGQVDLTMVSIGVTLPMMPQRLKPIALAGVERNPQLPSVPTFMEAGFKDFEVRAWFGLFAPRGTPDAVVALLRKEVWDIVSSKAFIDSAVLAHASEPSTVSPERLDAFLSADQEKWAGWVRRVASRIKI